MPAPLKSSLGPLGSRPGEDLDDDLLPPDEGVGEAAGGAFHQVAIASAGERLDKALADALVTVGGLSRSRLKALIEGGRVATDGQTIVDASYRVKPGQSFDIDIPAASPAEPAPQDIPLSILFEDEDLLVIDKPAGMVVHPAAGNPDGTLVNALLHHCGDRLSGIGGVRRPGIVHRLDKDTSGLMVVAKTDRAHHGLSAQFSDRTLSRTYIALVWGMPNPREGEVVGNIGRHPVDRKRMAVLPNSGKHAHTLYRVVRPLGRYVAQVECTLMTGRTHQIRVHMAEIGNALLGDPLYGKVRPARIKSLPAAAQAALADLNRQALHAWKLRFIHPVSGKAMEYTSSLPDDIQDLIHALESL